MCNGLLQHHGDIKGKHHSLSKQFSRIETKAKEASPMAIINKEDFLAMNKLKN
jgi:hypothetical protein